MTVRFRTRSSKIESRLLDLSKSHFVPLWSTSGTCTSFSHRTSSNQGKVNGKVSLSQSQDHNPQLTGCPKNQQCVTSDLRVLS